MTDERDTLLDDDAIDAAVAGLPAWRRVEGSLRAAYAAPTFPAAIGLVDAVAIEAERADHHPDIDIRWCTVTFVLSTHSAGGITGKDVDLAGAIAALAEQHAAVAG